jgi:hypothetical protein
MSKAVMTLALETPFGAPRSGPVCGEPSATQLGGAPSSVIVTLTKSWSLGGDVPAGADSHHRQAGDHGRARLVTDPHERTGRMAVATVKKSLY